MDIFSWDCYAFGQFWWVVVFQQPFVGVVKQFTHKPCRFEDGSTLAG